MVRIKQIKLLFKTNLIKTLWFNFKVLPWRQAIRMPFFIYGRFSLRSFEGSVEIDAPVLVPGMIKIGKRDWYVTNAIPQSVWTINGKIIFHGPVRFLHGSYVCVSRNAVLEIGTNGTFFGTNARIACFNSIHVGNDVQITWDVQLYDTSFHYVEDLQSAHAAPLTSPIWIGDNVWIGNRSTIAKGTCLPDSTIVASNSLCNKNYMEFGPDNLLAGCPAVVKKRGIRRIYDERREEELDRRFGYDRTHL